MTALAANERNAGMHQTCPPPSAVAAWIFFDWGAQPYFPLITPFFFAPYFATHVAPDPAGGQALWGFATAAAGLVIALLSPCSARSPIPAAGASRGSPRSAPCW